MRRHGPCKCKAYSSQAQPVPLGHQTTHDRSAPTRMQRNAQGLHHERQPLPISEVQHAGCQGLQLCVALSRPRPRGPRLAGGHVHGLSDPNRSHLLKPLMGCSPCGPAATSHAGASTCSHAAASQSWPYSCWPHAPAQHATRMGKALTQNLRLHAAPRTCHQSSVGSLAGWHEITAVVTCSHNLHRQMSPPNGPHLRPHIGVRRVQHGWPRLRARLGPGRSFHRLRSRRQEREEVLLRCLRMPQA